MKSSITLATLRIEEVGKYIYFKFLRKQLIPEDMCAELYEAVVTHLRRFREKNPEVKKVKRAFVTTRANWIANKLLKKEKKQETEESVVIELVKNELDALGETRRCSHTRRCEKRIIRAVEDLVNRGKIKMRHVLYYVLYHAYSTRTEFSVRLLKAAWLKTGENIRRLKRVRRHVDERSRKRRDKLIRNLENKYAAIIRKQQEIETLSGTQLKEEMDKSRYDLEKISLDRKRAINELSTIRVVPSTKYLGKMLDQPRSSIEYGIGRVEKLIMEKIKETEKEEGV